MLVWEDIYNFIRCLKIVERHGNYRSRFFGYYFVYGVVEIIDGIITCFLCFFGYSCILHLLFCEWNLKLDIKRARQRKR
jgi:hypothetical protein